MGPKAKGKKSEVPISSQQKTHEKTKPDWPVFKPLLPPLDLFLETLIPGQIVLVRNFWTATLCKNYVSFLSSLPLVTTPGKPKKGDAVRVNDRYQIEDELFARRLWTETALQALISGANLTGSADDAAGEDASARHADRWGGEVVRSPCKFPRKFSGSEVGR